MLTVSDMVDRLRSVGISAGDSVIVHSSLRQLGPMEEGADSLIDALTATVGLQGHVAMPTFNGLPRPHFDPDTTPSVTGTLTEVFRARPDVVRSLHPTHSLAVWGPDAEAITADHLTCDTLGVGSPIDRLADRGAYILLLGVSHTSNTTVHIGEAHAKVRKFFKHPDAEDNPPTARVRLPSGDIIDHTLDPSASCSFAFNAIEHPLRQRGAMRDFDMGCALCLCMRASDVIHATVDLLRESPDMLFCTRDNCLRCRRGRAFALRGVT